MFVIDVPNFNLNHIYDSGQVPRWICLNRSDEKAKYVIPHKDKALKIEQQRNKYDWSVHRLIMSCSEEDFYGIWFTYFDLKTDYLKESNRARKLGKKFKVVANRGNGIHIINQDQFEAYILSRIIEKAGYAKAKAAMNHIAETCGVEHVQSMKEAGKVVWYEWPTPEMILENSHKLKKMGNVNEWLECICMTIIERGFEFIIENSNSKLFKLLGLHDVNVFPLTEIEQTLAKNFGENPEEFEDWYLSDFENKGLVYLYILHHIKNPPREKMLYGVN